jgi:glycerol-3-phosphate acyltransferase PlsY
MEPRMIQVLLLITAYLLGTVPTGLWIVRAVRGVDVRSQGSGNIGATNVVRVAGWGWGLLTLILDVAKGAAAPLALAFTGLAPVPLVRWQIAAGVLALAGNILNPFLKFRGGKGVGTAIGVAVVLAPAPTGWGLLAFAVGFAATRIVSVGSLAAGTVFSISAALIYFGRRPALPVDWLIFAVAVGAMIFYTHRRNIRRLLRGEEAPLTKSK